LSVLWEMQSLNYLVWCEILTVLYVTYMLMSAKSRLQEVSLLKIYQNNYIGQFPHHVGWSFISWKVTGIVVWDKCSFLCVVCDNYTDTELSLFNSLLSKKTWLTCDSTTYFEKRNCSACGMFVFHNTKCITSKTYPIF
jgi:hypothetical protein